MSWLPGLKRALVVQDEGVALPVRGIVNIVGTGITASDDPANGRTNIAFSVDVVGTTDPTPNTLARRGAGGECSFLDVITPRIDSTGNLLISPGTGFDVEIFNGIGSATLLTTGSGAHVLIGDGSDNADVKLRASSSLFFDVNLVTRATLTATALTLAVPLALGTTPPATGDIRLGTGAIVNFKGAGFLTQNDGHSLLAWNTAKNITLGDAGDVPLLDLAAAEVRISTAAAGHVKLRPGGLDFLDVGPTICNFKRTYACAANIVTPGATTTFDLSTGNVQKVTLNQSSTIAFANIPNGARFAIHFVQDAIGSRVATWPASIKVAGGGGPGALSTGANAHDMMLLETDETGFLWLIVLVKNMS